MVPLERCTVGDLSGKSPRNLNACAEAYHRKLAIVKRLRYAYGEEYGSITNQRATGHYQPACKSGQNHTILRYIVGPLDQHGGERGLPHNAEKITSNPNLFVMDRRSAGKLKHEAATRTCKRLPKMIGEASTVTAASNSKTNRIGWSPSVAGHERNWPANTFRWRPPPCSATQ